MGKVVHPRRAAERLDVSPKRIYHLIRTGRLEAVNIGERQLRVKVESLERLTRGEKSGR